MTPDTTQTTGPTLALTRPLPLGIHLRNRVSRHPLQRRLHARGVERRPNGLIADVRPNAFIGVADLLQSAPTLTEYRWDPVAQVVVEVVLRRLVESVGGVLHAVERHLLFAEDDVILVLVVGAGCLLPLRDHRLAD